MTGRPSNRILRRSMAMAYPARVVTAAATLFAFFGAGVLAAQPAPPVTASPGHDARFALVRGSCPTFSWGMVPGASGYEIEVFRVDATTGEPLGGSVISLWLHGSVTSWTPAAGECMEAGAAYAWSARAEADGRMSEWSDVRLLRVSDVPGPEEVAHAQRVLARFLASEGLPAGGRRGARPRLQGGVLAPEESSRASSGRTAPRVTDTAANGRALAGPIGGSAAIRGQNTDLTGNANGVVGISSSSGGAGVVAAGADGGADLVLDGSTGSETDTLLSQGGVDRASTSAETFTLENSGGGGLIVDIDGALVADSLVGDGAGLTGVSADDIVCAGCVGNSDLAANSVTSSKIGTSSVRASEIATNAVGASEIAADAVGASELAANSVGASEIITGAVGADEVDTVRVVSVECNGSCADSTSTLSVICGVGYSAIAVDCSAVEPDDSEPTIACGGNNICFRRFVSDSHTIGTYCLGVSGWDAHVFCLED